MRELKTPRDIASLPDGTVFESLPECLWPQRYAGVRWKKVGDGVMPVGTSEAKRAWVYPSLIPFFKDPLPAMVVSSRADETAIEVRMSETRGLADWRANRDPGWFNDVGYALQDELGRHIYIYDGHPTPGKPGWHHCTCGWEGYWSGFHPHVTDHLRAVVL